MIDRSEDSKFEIVDALLIRKDSYLSFAELMAVGGEVDEQPAGL